MSGKLAAKGAAVKGKKAGKGGAAEEKREDVLQAVVRTNLLQRGLYLP